VRRSARSFGCTGTEPATLWFMMTLALLVALATAELTAQVTAEAVVTLSSDTIGQGDVFDFSVAVHVPAGSAVYFPDTVATAFALESFRPVTWSVEAAEGGALLTLTYPLIAFRVGSAPVPELDIYIGAAAGVGGERLPGGSVVGSWGDIESGTESRAALSRAAVPSRDVWVASVIVLEDLDGALEPRPPADVVGPGWNRLAVAAIIALALLLLAVARSIALDMHPDRPLKEPLVGVPISESSSVRWQKALDELDRILALGLHTEGRTDEFYERSSTVVRTFVEGFDTEWRPSLTSLELMSRLEAWTNGSALELYASMHTAEVVKFGRLRPDASTAEGHWRDLRNWVHASRSIEP
jgi:hypothetical protein